LILFRIILPIVLGVVAIGAAFSGILHLTIGTVKLLFAAIVVLVIISLVAGRSRRR